ncbi:hypothetical protein SAMN02745181_0097 [Rubritalea squalenifaciens DSM 18772]|uniref:Uncharacterized protein n=1 Tax=Rubritalea squalenifaciens DSM 18772 TaxID=1123071 RepID=A0A1M6B1Y6_9BACT|nr:hypothetical protein SAMN02745181_0097 [Rubritalea squalenifaciens DSM 18772]
MEVHTPAPYMGAFVWRDCNISPLVSVFKVVFDQYVPPPVS